MKEKSGLKNNTVRFQDDSDDIRFEMLGKWKPTDNLYVYLKNTETGKGFTRKIRDVSWLLIDQLGHCVTTITWEHKEDREPNASVDAFPICSVCKEHTTNCDFCNEELLVGTMFYCNENGSHYCEKCNDTRNQTKK